MNKARRRWFTLFRFGLYILAIYIMLRWFEHKQIYYPSRRMDTAPGQLGRPFEDVFIPVEHGERINAWYFPAQSSSSPVVLLCHGNAGNIGHRLDLGAMLLEAGAGVLLVDYRGYGRSDGRPGEENTYRDAQAAYHWLMEKGIAGTNIIGYGESLGGGIVSELAMREPLGGLILQSTFSSMTDLGAEIFPWLPVRLISTIKYNTRAKLPKIHVPVLILHSPKDDLIPFHHAKDNFAAANEPKFLREISGGHNDALWSSRPAMEAAIKEFLQIVKHNEANFVPGREGGIPVVPKKTGANAGLP
jgi:fermentation-respiration switch protein FrsA (DUF1100 family)